MHCTVVIAACYMLMWHRDTAVSTIWGFCKCSVWCVHKDDEIILTSFWDYVPVIINQQISCDVQCDLNAFSLLWMACSKAGVPQTYKYHKMPIQFVFLWHSNTNPEDSTVREKYLGFLFNFLPDLRSLNLE